MTETVDFTPEVVNFIKEAVYKDGRWMAVMGKAIYDKYGEEAIKVLCGAFYAFGESDAEACKKETIFEGKQNKLNVGRK